MLKLEKSHQQKLLEPLVENDCRDFIHLWRAIREIDEIHENTHLEYCDKKNTRDGQLRYLETQKMVNKCFFVDVLWNKISLK